MDKLLLDILSLHNLNNNNNILKTKTIRQYYLKHEQINGGVFYLPFKDVLTNWEDNKIIDHIRFDEVFLNHDVINIIQNSSDIGTRLLEEVKLKYLKDLLDPHKPLLQCLICNTRVGTLEELGRHNQSIDHLLRVDFYLKNPRNRFTTQKLFDITLYDLKKRLIVTEITATTDGIEILVVLINTSNEVLEITNITRLNLHVCQLYINSVNGKPKILNQRVAPRETVSFRIMGRFYNSADLKFPICVTVSNGRVDQHVLVEFDVKISSRWSYLDSGVDYEPKPKRQKVFAPNERIVAGETPKNAFLSSKIEPLPLYQYRIPREFEELLIRYTAKHPGFIKRTLNIEFNFRQSAKEFGLPTILNKSNYTNLLMHLLHIEEYQMQVDYKDFNIESTVTSVILPGGRNVFKLEVLGLAQSRLTLARYDSVYLKVNPFDHVKYEGKVHQVLGTSVFLGFNTKFLDIFVPNKKFYIEFGFNRRTIKVEKQAVAIAHDNQMVPYFFPKEVYIIENNFAQFSQFSTSLNQEQERAIRNLLTRKSAPYLIFGPPGTGKTVTVVEAILQIYKTQLASKILVCAPSNEAANEIAIRLLKKIPAREMSRLVGSMYGNSQSAAKRNLAEIMNCSRDGTHFMPKREQILQYRVVIVTLATAARLINSNLPQKHFSYVFIDESGCASETASLIPLAGVLSAGNQIFGQLVLAGDPKQLGPIVHSNFAKYCGFEKSMLERLIDSCALYARDETKEVPYDERFVTKLIRNYRSHPNILQVSNELFYHNELKTVGTQYTHIFVGWDGLKNPKFPVMFHHVQGNEKREEDSPSYFNTQEIEEVAGYLEKIVGSRVNGLLITEEHIGIISPYRKQADKMIQMCEKLRMTKVTVGTVEQFQGKEKLVIIMSTVRSKNTHKFEDLDKKYQTGFLKNPKRFNVAITRAKALLIVVGNAELLNTEKHWRTFIKYCQDHDSLVGKPVTPPIIELTDDDDEVKLEDIKTDEDDVKTEDAVIDLTGDDMSEVKLEDIKFVIEDAAEVKIEDTIIDLTEEDMSDVEFVDITYLINDDSSAAQDVKVEEKVCGGIVCIDLLD